MEDSQRIRSENQSIINISTQEKKDTLQMMQCPSDQYENKKYEPVEVSNRVRIQKNIKYIAIET